MRSEQSSSSPSNSQDVMDRLQKRDLSIFKTGDKSSTSETIDLEPEEPLVNIKEEAPSEINKMEEPETQLSVENDSSMAEYDSNTMTEYDQTEYDESYAGKLVFRIFSALQEFCPCWIILLTVVDFLSFYHTLNFFPVS